MLCACCLQRMCVYRCVSGENGIILFPPCLHPGLLWREQEAAVMYGSIDGGKTIAADPTFSELVRARGTDQLTTVHHHV